MELPFPPSKGGQEAVSLRQHHIPSGEKTQEVHRKFIIYKEILCELDLSGCLQVYSVFSAINLNSEI